jgi:hypothetical protein
MSMIPVFIRDVDSDLVIVREMRGYLRLEVAHHSGVVDLTNDGARELRVAIDTWLAEYADEDEP